MCVYIHTYSHRSTHMYGMYMYDSADRPACVSVAARACVRTRCSNLVLEVVG